MNPKIIPSLRNKFKLTKRYYSYSTEENKNLLTAKSNECSNVIVETKKMYTNKLSRRLDDPSTMPKAYWSILNTFLNSKNIPYIHPLNVNGKLISNFEKKAELFNSHFASQCTPINNSSVFPPLEYKTNERLTSVNMKEDDIYLKNLNPEKAHRWDGISNRMIQLCGKAIVEPLRILFLSFLEEGVYPDDWKESNVVPIRKKDSKNLIKLFTKCQSGFLPGRSCIPQLFSITHEIYKSLDCNPSVNVRGTFIDISKAFDKVWHDGLISKPKSYGVENKLLNLIQNYLTNRQQCVLFNG